MSDEEEYAYEDGGDEYAYQADEQEDYVYMEEDEDIGAPPELKKASSYPDAFKIPDGDYKLLDYKEMIPMMTSIVNDVASLLGVHYDSALILLTHFDWNKERLVDAYWSNTSAVLSSAGIVEDRGSRGCPPLAEVECKICLDKAVPYADTIGLACDHNFCK